MKKICVLLLYLSTITFNKVEAGGFEDFMATINKQCPGINQLVIKKSLIELAQAQNCNSAFTSLLLRDCGTLSCKELLGYWLSFNGSKSGTVIGK